MIPAQSHPIPPVLFLVFNRPDLARRVFARIREARPAHLFIAADGPRPDHPDDVPACRETRLLAAQVDWPCEVKTLFRDANLGCRAAVSSAITWFFEHVEAGIILEDDCLPDLSFFPFCAELLERYRDDERITTISAMGYPRAGLCGRHSYFFSGWTASIPPMCPWHFCSAKSWLVRTAATLDIGCAKQGIRYSLHRNRLQQARH